MLAKLIAWAPTRDLAISRLNRGLEETDVRGIVTNIPFLSALITHPDVRANKIDTSFIERELAKLTPPEPELTELELGAAVAAILRSEEVTAAQDVKSPWRRRPDGRPRARVIAGFCFGSPAASERLRCDMAGFLDDSDRGANSGLRELGFATRRPRSCPRRCQASRYWFA